jgi:hypothetical protein
MVEVMLLRRFSMYASPSGDAILGFVKPSGERYVEAHHVMQVAKMEVGSLGSSNIMILCAIHHRQLHYGGIEVVIGTTTFDFVIDGREVRIARPGIAATSHIV